VAEVTVFFREWQHLTGENLATVKARRLVYHQAIRDLIEAAQDDGDVSPDLDLRYAAFYVLGAVNAVPDWYSTGGRDPGAHIAVVYADMTFDLLTGTRPHRPRTEESAADARPR
jgi:TetR/AcrR family transcriptional regulator, cholesterol catabolism regulator